MYVLGKVEEMEVVMGNGRATHTSGCFLDTTTTQQILGRTGQVRLVQVTVKQEAKSG